MKMNKIELLAPAGSQEKLETAIRYGADAVYMGSGAFSLRTTSASFELAQLAEAVQYAHQHQVKAYLAVNLFARQSDLTGITQHLKAMNHIQPDALIIADPGILSLARRLCPDIPLHISTQASVTNAETCHFWYEQGVRRIILARELSLDEIKEIKKQVPDDLELETFVHGAMCMAWSGRCLLSNLLTGRDANRGECAQPCRWSWQFVEEKHQDHPIALQQDQHGSYFFSSLDLCMIEHIPALMEAGISSFKIEGRTKSSFYTATVVKAYREAIDAWYADPEHFKVNPAWFDDLNKTKHRPFGTGFFFSDPMHQAQVDTKETFQQVATVVGLVKKWVPEEQLALVEQRNKIFKHDKLECVQPVGRHISLAADQLYDEDRQPLDSTPHAKMMYYLKSDLPLQAGAFLRRIDDQE